MSPQQMELVLQGKADNIDLQKIISKQLPASVKLSIDFTKLAKIADSKGRKNLANFLIK